MGWETWLIGTISRALAYGTPLLLGTLGEIYAERSGVLNLGVEGMMVMGAFSAFATAYTTGNPWLGLLVAACVGGAFSLIHAFVSITLRANQIVSGLALTMLGLGLAGVLGRGWEGKPLEAALPALTVPHLAKIPGLGPSLFVNQNALVYLAAGLAVLLWFVLYKTKIGISIRAVGDDPATADAMGVNVFRTRYLCVLLGGVLAGLGGGYLSVAYRPAWTEGMTAGMGWIVIALTIFAFWNPLLGLVGAYFFGALYHLSYRLQPWTSPELLKTMPYVFAILVLALVARGTLKRRMNAPAALCEPYIRGEE
ncbi:MAG: ABC transporter permease [Candidatus Acetothermia bacterium]|jgi:simple sugar transport system permease protein|nr:ABC transporter permease [Candidatus Acetothermia bacterium]MDH7505085.1 ABC transporter permease [Candidatus Acetothermia bacterium]